MPRRALTLFSSTTPRILPAVVLATGPCPELSLALAATNGFNAPLRMPDAPSAAPLTKARRFILVFIVNRAPFYTFEGHQSLITSDPAQPRQRPSQGRGDRGQRNIQNLGDLAVS